MSLYGNTIEEKVWNYLYNELQNPYGVSGLLGNLYAESGIIFNIVENLCLIRLKEKGIIYTSESYTKAVDNGSISKETFLNPLPGKVYGYGLCQWTSTDRKLGLYNLAKSKNVSIADPECQLEYLIYELKNKYSSVFKTLKSATSVKEASDIVLTKFEIPSDTSSSVRNLRCNYSQAYYNKYANLSNKNGGKSMISNSGSDENKKYHGGVAGDQTGREWAIIEWYNRPWNCVIRHPNYRVREMIASLSEKAAKNDKIGYDQYQRDTYWQQLVKANYDPSKINVACESDCSAGVIANTKATGYLLGIAELKNISATYTGNMRTGFKLAGFEILTDSKYLTSPDYLLRGDILLNDKSHTATNLTNGKYAASSNSSTVVTNNSYSGKGIGTATALTEMNIRTGDGTNYSVCGKVSKGTKLEVLEILPSGWYKVVWAGESCGYAYTSCQKNTYYSYEKNKVENKLNNTKKFTGKVIATTLNVREYAGTEYNKIKSYPTLKKGDLVSVCDTVKDSKKDNWYYVKIANKYFGFVSSKYVAKV